MARMTKVGVGYNIQLAVDVKHKLIAEQEVSTQVLDMGLLAPTVEAAMETLGVDRIEAVADRGYFKIEDIEACEKADITAYVPEADPGPCRARGLLFQGGIPLRSGQGHFPLPRRSGALAPSLRQVTRQCEDRLHQPRRLQGVPSCHLRERCTKSFRRVSRLENEAVLDRMAARLAVRPDILDRRRESVEHPFGTIKQWMNQGAFLMRRLAEVGVLRVVPLER
ncbi:hypothetical protein ACVJBD_006825 [Rhizobium mongolense]